MADQSSLLPGNVMEGPPAKRQKLTAGVGGGPAGPTALSNQAPPDPNTDQFNIGKLLDELPDELGNLTGDGGSNGPLAQNGAKDPLLLPQLDNTSQKHQQLSQLLSNSTPNIPNTVNNALSPQPTQGTVPGTSVPQVLGTLNNAVKSPLSTNLSSPPMGQHRPGPTSTPHSMNNDMLANAVFSSGATSTVMGSFTVASTGNSQPLTTKAMLGGVPNNAGNMHNNQLMNGPHLGIQNSGPGNPAVNRSIASSLPGIQGNMMAGGNMGPASAVGAAGQLNNQQTLGHPALGGQAQAASAQAGQQQMLIKQPGDRKSVV